VTHPIVVDTETHLIGPFQQAPRIVSTAISSDPGRVEVCRGSDALASVIREPRHRSRIVVGHNIAYDMACLVAHRPELFPEVFEAYESDRITDTMIRQQLCDLGFGIGLSRSYDLASVRYRIDKVEVPKGEETWRTRYAELDGIDPSQWPVEAYRYAADDVVHPRVIYDAQEARPESGQWLRDQYRQARAAFALRLVACWGLVPHPERVRDWKSNVQAEYNRLEVELRDAGLLSRSGSRDTKAARKLLEDQSILEGFALDVTPAGDASLAADQLRKSHDPRLLAYARIGEVKALLSKDLRILERPICHTRFGLAASGRVTSTDPNIQNFGRGGGVRECFEAPPGKTFVIADYSTLELRTLAQVQIALFGSSRLAEAISAGVDVHLDLASSELLGVPYAEGLARYNAGDPEVKRYRQIAKGANFGFPGGLGAGAMVGYIRASTGGKIVLSIDETRDLRAKWLRRWDMDTYFRWVRSHTDHGAPLEQLYSGRVRGGCGFTDGANTMFQGLAADLAKDALFHVVQACYVRGVDDRLYGCRVVNFVHDEIDLLADEDRAEDAGKALREMMIEAGRRWCPDVPIDASVGTSKSLAKE
jgi:DNA polymerase I